MTTIQIKQKYQIESKGKAPEGYPQECNPDTYSAGPVETTYEERRVALISHVMRNPAPTNTRTIWYELIRMAGGGQAHEGYIFSALDFINDRKDCSDFVAHSVLRLLYQFDPERNKMSPNAQELKIKTSSIA